MRAQMDLRTIFVARCERHGDVSFDSEDFLTPGQARREASKFIRAHQDVCEGQP